MFSLSLLGLLAHAGPAVPIPPVNPCMLVSVAEATAILGTPVSAGKPTAEVKDEDTSGMVTFCMMMAGQKGVMVALVRYKSNADALKEVNKGMVQKSVANSDDDADPVTIVEEPGIGERGFFGSNKVSATLLIVRGQYALAVGAMSQGKPTTAELHASLRKAAQTALARLPE